MKSKNISSMTTRTNSSLFVTGAAVALAAIITLPSFAQDKDEHKPKDGDKKHDKAASGKPSEQEMMAMMMEMAKPGENHKMLESSVGSWSYTVKWWMSPDAPPMESTGTSIGRSVASSNSRELTASEDHDHKTRAAPEHCCHRWLARPIARPR